MKKIAFALTFLATIMALGGVSLFAQTAPAASPNVATSTTSTTTKTKKTSAKKQTKSTAQVKSTAGK